MNTKTEKYYINKGKDSFKTKFNLYLFSKALTDNIESVDLEDFKNFKITEDLVLVFTAEYWQYKKEVKIPIGGSSGRSICDVERDHLKSLKEINPSLFEQNYLEKWTSEIYPRSKFETLLSPGKCHYCQITEAEIEHLADRRKLYKKNFRGWSLEVDRKNSNFEYTPENCVMACYWCNNAKTDEFTEEEFLPVGLAIRKVWDSRI